MFFKSLIAYQLSQPIDITNLNEQAKSYPARPCGTNELQTFGFARPTDMSSEPIWCSEKYHLLRVEKNEKMIPTAVLNKRVQREVDALEKEANAKLSKKAVERVKERMVYQMAQVAFERTATTDIVITRDYMWVNTASHSVAESCLALIRRTINSLPAFPLVRTNLSRTLTDWVYNQTPDNVVLLEEVKLLGGDGEVIKFKDVSPEEECVIDLIGEGYHVDELAIEFNGAIKMSIGGEGTVKRIKFNEDGESQFDTDFIINCKEIEHFVIWIKEICGELQQAESD